MSDIATHSVNAPQPLREHVAEEIRALLGRRRMSNIELSRRIGKSHTYVWRRLNGETAFDLDDLEGIARTLGVGVGDLLPPRSGGLPTGRTGDGSPRDPLAPRIVAIGGGNLTLRPKRRPKIRPRIDHTSGQPNDRAVIRDRPATRTPR